VVLSLFSSSNFFCSAAFLSSRFFCFKSLFAFSSLFLDIEEIDIFDFFCVLSCSLLLLLLFSKEFVSKRFSFP
jgi:hypothetical protein